MTKYLYILASRAGQSDNVSSISINKSINDVKIHSSKIL